MNAIISDCEFYRYSLTRKISDRGWNVSVIMVNPSVADATNDDPTIKKLIGFGTRLGWQTITVGNLFAYRATDVNQVAIANDPIGPMNDAHLLNIMLQTDLTVVAWGASGKLPPRLRQRYKHIVTIAKALNRPLWCFGTCNDGHPKHPVMIAYASIMQHWKEV